MPAYVPACARTMAVFDVFARERTELSNSDLARLLDLPESSTSDLLHTLYQGGYVIRTAKTRRFYPTSRLLTLATEIVKNDPIFTAAAEALDVLSHKTGETSFSGVLDEGTVKIVAAKEGGHPLRYILQVGERIALNGSAMGKALLSELDDVQASREMERKPLRAYTDRTITEPEKLVADVKKQRVRGWFCADQEGNDGVTAYAIAGSLGDTLLSLSVAGPSDRMTRNRAQYVKALEDMREVVFSEGRAARGAGQKARASISLT